MMATVPTRLSTLPSAQTRHAVVLGSLLPELPLACALTVLCLQIDVGASQRCPADFLSYSNMHGSMLMCHAGIYPPAPYYRGRFR